MPTAVANQPRLLEYPGCHRDAGSSNAQHLREKFLSQWDFIRIEDFAADHQPSTQARFQCVESVAESRLRNLRQNEVQIPQDQVAQIEICVELIQHGLCFDFGRLTCNLHHRSIRHPVRLQHEI